ncbi:MAG: protein TolQ [Deltaproteobacteria bacterium]|nr:protein TolQ [Deltaproteobacteria bacterium]MBW1913687.1 protein TolQ [Deltaproteobacteria bacterium]
MTVLSVLPLLALPAASASDSALGGNVIQMFIHAGLVVKLVLLILMAFSVVSWAIILTKWRFFRDALYETDYFLDIFWETSEFSNIYNECEDLDRSPVAQVFKSGYSELKRMMKIHNLSEETDVGMDGLTEYVERSLRKATIFQTGRMEKALSFLATTGNTAPFIGLFGTVWGIMESFRGIGMSGSASLAVVAPGIAEALIATAAGLGAAIPAVVAYNYFSSRVAGIRTEMNTFSADFLALVERQILKKNLSAKKD